MIRTARTITTTTKNRTARPRIAPPLIAPTSSSRNERCRAVDLQDFHARSRLDDLVLVVGARAPHLATDLHAATVAIYLLEHRGARADQRRGPGSHVRRDPDVAFGD